MPDLFDEQNSFLPLFRPVFKKLGITVKHKTAYVPCNPATQPELAPKDESLSIFIDDLVPVFDIVATLSETENHQFMEQVRIAWFSVWPLEEDDILVLLEKENVELEVISKKLNQRRVARAAHHNQIKPGSWRPIFHERLHLSKYAAWAHYVSPPPGPFIMELDLTDPEDWLELATLAICDPTQTQWCKGYRVWSTGADDEEETTDEESEGFSDSHDSLTDMEENEK
ncbi:hypothetical protein GYMLUDRAFT_247689 [Collybiopsis luxurians FD-317 M1]|uniref:Uncharacterized protein n=1 Tax=Collybiopsis luxurians FD-317 M1 TaxID=944289 RepID=A0A0D0CF13_9AGAR|nr:hypothetical protein GYMLUDRAFT_247689 [Collybiopsis luxurians FD-317 M1]